MKLNKLTINYKISCNMLAGKKCTKIINFKNYQFQIKNSIKYLGIHLYRELLWKNHIDYLTKKLSKVC